MLTTLMALSDSLSQTSSSLSSNAFFWICVDLLFVSVIGEIAMLLKIKERYAGIAIALANIIGISVFTLFNNSSLSFIEIAKQAMPFIAVTAWALSAIHYRYYVLKETRNIIADAIEKYHDEITNQETVDKVKIDSADIDIRKKEYSNVSFESIWQKIRDAEPLVKLKVAELYLDNRVFWTCRIINIKSHNGKYMFLFGVDREVPEQSPNAQIKMPRFKWAQKIMVYDEANKYTHLKSVKSDTQVTIDGRICEIRTEGLIVIDNAIINIKQEQ